MSASVIAVSSERKKLPLVVVTWFTFEAKTALSAERKEVQNPSRSVPPMKASTKLPACSVTVSTPLVGQNSSALLAIESAAMMLLEMVAFGLVEKTRAMSSLVGQNSSALLA